MSSKNKTKYHYVSTFDQIYQPFNDRDTIRKYQKLLPPTIRSMESKLCDFVKNYDNDCLDINPCEKFAIRQLIKIARSVCTKSLRGGKLTTDYFEEMTQDIRKLIAETVEKSPFYPTVLENLSRKFLLITCDSSRVLALIENHFNSSSLDALNLQNTEQDLVSYIRKNLNNKISPIVPMVNRSQLIINKGEHLYNISIQPPTLELNESKSSTQYSYLPQESNFKIITLLSQGAYGAVYLVEHSSTQQPYAMKKILKSHAIMKNQVRQIFAERDILSFIDNPFVISMFCSFETHNAFCMVMEFAEGGDCASLLKYVSVLPLDISRIFIAETIIALEYIHNYGIVHRDIKPDNLLITSLGHIKLTDFGLSKIGLMNLTTYDIDETKNNFTDLDILGTPNYIAPEIILNMPYGKVIDYWSVGIVLYEFLVGCTPFMGSNVEEVFEAIISSPIEWPQDNETVDPDAQIIISRFLDRDPNKRLGYFGAKEVKSHIFFDNVKWDYLLHSKAQFIEMRNNDSETKCFDDRCSRYHHHEILSNDSDDTPISTQNSFQSFTSYTKRFKNAIDDSSAFSTDNESIFVSQDEKLDKELDRNDLAETALLSLTKIVHIGSIDNRNIKLNIGISIKTARIICQKNIFFLLHIIDCIVPNSLAEKAGLKSGQAVIFLNNDLMIGEQHIFVIKYLLYQTIESIGVCCLDQIGITYSKNIIETFTIDTNSLFFKLLLKLRIHFERILDFQTFPVKLNSKADIEDLNDSCSTGLVKNTERNVIPNVSVVSKIDENENHSNVSLPTSECLTSLSNDVITNKQNKIIEKPKNSFRRHTFTNFLSEPFMLPKSSSQFPKNPIQIKSDVDPITLQSVCAITEYSEPFYKSKIHTRSKSEGDLNLIRKKFGQ